MWIRSLRLYNFYSHRDSRIDFDYPLSMAIVGGNGCGKSSIIEGIYYALTGEVLREVPLANITTAGETRHQVELRFVHNDVEYEIIRGYNNNDPNRKREVVVRERPYTEDNREKWRVSNDLSRKIQQGWKINRWKFGVDDASLKNTVIIGQNDVDGLVAMTPKERRDLLIDLLFNGSVIEKINQKLSASIKEWQSIRNDLLARKRSLQPILVSEEDQQQLVAENATIDKQIEELNQSLFHYQNTYRPRAIATLVQQYGISLSLFQQALDFFFRELEPAIHAYRQEYALQINHLNKDLENLREEYNRQKQNLTRVKELTEYVRQHEVAIANLESIQKEYEQESTHLRLLSHLDGLSLQNNICPCCGRIVHPHEEEMVATYRKQQRQQKQSLSKKVAELSEKIKKIKELQQSVMEKRLELARLEGGGTTQENLDAIRRRGIEVKELLERESHRYQNQVSYRGGVASQIFHNSRLHAVLGKSKMGTRPLYAYWVFKQVKKKFPDFTLTELPDIARLSVDLDTEIEHITDLSARIREIQSQIEQLREKKALNLAKLEQSHKAEISLQEIEKRMTANDEKLAIDETLKQVLSTKDGAPAMALEESIAHLNQLASLFASHLSPDIHAVTFQLSKTTKQGDEVPTLEIQVSKQGGTLYYGSLSGGEKVKVAFAIRLAISKLLLNQKDLRFIILDESMSPLDASSRTNLISLLKEMDIPQILVITHQEDVANHFDKVMMVSKDSEKGSRVTYRQKRSQENLVTADMLL